MAKVKILIATHKQYEFPEERCYVPIHVGKALKPNELNMMGDDSGENISLKNSSFCELTALYWAWKNHFFADSDYVGLVHYRRYFAGSGVCLKQQKIASEAELLADLKQCDALVAKQRNYYIENVYNHYKHAHYVKDLDLTKRIITQDYPEYLSAFECVLAGKKLHLFNMFVLKREAFERYCPWLFDILFKLERQIDITDYDSYQKRVFGFLAERLFNVWLVRNNLTLKEINVVHLEREKLILKAIHFLRRKFLNIM